jgi:hypothetical protein
MSNDPKDREDVPPGDMPDEFVEATDRAMLSAISQRQRDNTPLSLDQERLLDSWMAGHLPPNEADRAADLTKSNILAAERILERRLLAAANAGPDVPNTLSGRILRASRSPRPGLGRLLKLRWPTLSAWQWSGLGAATAASIALVAAFGLVLWQGLSDQSFQFARVQSRSDQSFQIAMVTIEDRDVLVEGPRYRTRGSQEQTFIPSPPSSEKPAEKSFSDVQVPTRLLRRAISSASYDKQSIEHSELMTYLRARNESFDSHARILIDSALADSVSESVPKDSSAQIRAYDLNDPRNLTVRSKIRTLSVDAHAILLTLRR